MTSIVGVFCKDGVVVGIDSSATFSIPPKIPTIEQPTDKLYLIADRMILASTGELGYGQRFSEVIKNINQQDGFRGSPVEIGKRLSREFIEDLRYTYVQPGGFGALVAFAIENAFQLCEFSGASFQPELKTARLWYCSMGAAQHITDPFLAFIRNVFWKAGQPSMHEGIFAAWWTLDHAIEVNPGGVNGPINIAVLERTKAYQIRARVLSADELGEHKQNVKEAKDRLRQFPEKHSPEAAKDLDIPKPK